MSSPEVKIISLTITESGYNHRESTDDFDSENTLIAHDLAGWSSLNVPPKTVFGYLARALRARRERRSGGCAIMSCDNIQGNGDMTKRMLCSFIAV